MVTRPDRWTQVSAVVKSCPPTCYGRSCLSGAHRLQLAAAAGGKGTVSRPPSPHAGRQSGICGCGTTAITSATTAPSRNSPGTSTWRHWSRSYRCRRTAGNDRWSGPAFHLRGLEATTGVLRSESAAHRRALMLRLSGEWEGSGELTHDRRIRSLGAVPTGTDALRSCRWSGPVPRRRRQAGGESLLAYTTNYDGNWPEELTDTEAHWEEFIGWRRARAQRHSCGRRSPGPRGRARRSRGPRP